MTRIKLFVDGHVFDGPNQGTTTFLRGLYSNLVKLDYPIETYVGSESKDLLEKEPWIGSSSKIISYRSRNRYARLSLEIPSIIRAHGIDYAHFQYFTPFIKNCAWIVTIHDLLFNDFPEDFPLSYRILRNTLFRYSAFRSEIKTTVSEYSRRTIQRDFDISSQQVHVLPNAVDMHFFDSYSKEESRAKINEGYGVNQYLLYVSRLEPRKNHEVLARAFFELQLDQQGYQLVFVGKKSLAVPGLDSYLSGLPAERRKALRHFDSVGQADLMNFYRATSLFVYPSKAEGFGIPPLEAAAMGIPTLCANATAMADFDFLGEGLFSPDDCEDLKRKILWGLNGGISLNQLQVIREAIRSRYSWELSAKRLGDLILSDYAKR